MMKRPYVCAAANVPVISSSRVSVNRDYPQNTSVAKGSLHVRLDANEVNTCQVTPVRERAVGLRARGNTGPLVTTASASPSRSHMSGPNTPSDEIDTFLQRQTRSSRKRTAGPEQMVEDARKRQKLQGSPMSEYDSDIPVDSSETDILKYTNNELSLQLSAANHELHTQNISHQEKFSRLKRESESYKTKARDGAEHAARIMERQEERIARLTSDLGKRAAQLEDANKTIQKLKARIIADKQTLSKTERKAKEFEAWGRETKTYYQRIIKQIESNQYFSMRHTVSPSPSRSEYPKELPLLPSFRVIPPTDENENKQDEPSTPMRENSDPRLRRMHQSPMLSPLLACLSDYKLAPERS